VKLHLLCATNRVPVSFELTAANVAEVLLVEELLSLRRSGRRDGEKALWGPRLPWRSARTNPGQARGAALVSERAERRPAIRQQVEVCLAALKGVFGMEGTLAKTLVGLARRIAAKVAAYTYGCYINGLLGRSQGHIKELWA
jgi:hypothetical protein